MWTLRLLWKVDLFFPSSYPIFDCISSNELELPEEEQLVFSASSEQYREMGLICVPLTEREIQLKQLKDTQDLRKSHSRTQSGR